MFREHFKLAIEPFGVTPDPKFLYLSQTHREALASVFYAIYSDRGFAALIAPPGMGKTTLLTHLLGMLGPSAQTAFLFQTLCGPEDFLRFLLADLGIENKGDLACMHANLNAYLLEQSKNGRKVVVIIDEAQNLDDRVLELVRMLSNFESPARKLLHFVLAGQPQLAQRLGSEQLVQLRQRISIVARMNPLKTAETREYIEHRLRVAGGASDEPIFSKAAYEMIAEHSGGIPRNINNLCFNSMSLACALKRSKVEALMVQEVIGDLDLRPLAVREQFQQVTSSSRASRVGTVLSAPLQNRMPLAAGLLMFVVGASGLLWATWRGNFASGSANYSYQQRPYQQKVASISELAPSRAVLAPEHGNTPAPQTLVPVRHASETLGTPAAALRSENHTNSKHRPEHSTSKPQGPSELGELPLPAMSFEHLWGPKIGELTVNRQVLEQMQAPSDKVPVPFEPARQREKQ
jgi:general secretion pathway protein A